jgi:hypothetical protein
MGLGRALEISLSPPGLEQAETNSIRAAAAASRDALAVSLLFDVVLSEFFILLSPLLFPLFF